MFKSLSENKSTRLGSLDLDLAWNGIKLRVKNYLADKYQTMGPQQNKKRNDPIKKCKAF